MVTRWKIVSSLISLSLGALGGCSVVDVPPQPPGLDRVGVDTYEFCTNVATSADDRSQRYLVTGIVMGVAAAAATLTGGIIGPGKASGGWAEENRNALIVASGTVLAIPTTAFLVLQKNSSAAASSAGLALGQFDPSTKDGARRMKLACLEARSEIVNGRSAAGKIVIDAMDAAREEIRAKEEEEEREARADEEEASLGGARVPEEAPEEEAPEEEAPAEGVPPEQDGLARASRLSLYPRL